jgi:hypothetical protein
MIRDPSDGSVREPLPDADEIVADGMRAAQKLGSYLVDQAGERLGLPPVIDTTTSGLQTGSSKPENLARLEKSRDWLKDYFHRKTEGELK